MPNADNFRTELRSQIERAARQGRPHIEVNSGQLHRDVGDYPGPDHRMPICCSVMESEMRAGDVIVAAPPKGKGASLTIRYALPRR
jgi:hypothetical protein